MFALQFNCGANEGAHAKKNRLSTSQNSPAPQEGR
jgi:hypothetical protein